MKAQCALCGCEYDPAPRAACASCPLGVSCSVTCCPRCGYAVPAPEGSTLVRIFDRLFSRRTAP